VQTPLQQASGLAVQALLQAPQLLLSIWVLVQVPLQHESLAAQPQVPPQLSEPPQEAWLHWGVQHVAW
jgi:hypothetical protein